MDIKHQDTGASKPAAEKHGSALSERSLRMPNRQTRNELRAFGDRGVSRCYETVFKSFYQVDGHEAR